MDQEELKRKLMGLWEKTTHNSKELVSSLFDYYFNPDFIEYKEIDGKIVCGLFGIPYYFTSGKKHLNGLYLISLSSEEGFRKKGILAELLNKFNDRIKEDFDFSFLVPHTELLADYFGTQGYHSSFFVLEERFTPLHDFRHEYFLSLTDSDEKIRDLKKGLIDKIAVAEKKGMEDDSSIIVFIKSIESKSSSSVSLVHSAKDLEYALEENNLRNLSCFIAYDYEGKITGVAFTQKEDIKRTRIVASYVSDSCSFYSLLDYIKREFYDHSISIISSDPQFQIQSLIQKTYASENKNGGDLDNTFSTVEIPFNINKLLQPLGMVKLLKYDSIIQFIAETRSDAEFKLHIKDYKCDAQTEHDIVYVVKNGKMELRELSEFKNDRPLLSLSKKEVSELLLRKNDSSNLIMEAFGIPRLNLQMRLLPY